MLKRRELGILSHHHGRRRRPHCVDAKDRSKNIVVFGVAEDRSAVVWRQTVDAALRHVTGSDIDVVRPWADGGPHAPPHYLHSLVFSFTPGSVDLEKAC